MRKSGNAREPRIGRGLWFAVALLAGTIVVLGLGPLSYARFSWQALGQPYVDGQVCTSPTECISGFCTDGVCCNEACDGADQRCNTAGRVGVCVSLEQVPVMSHVGNALAVLLLFGAGVYGWRAGRKRS